MTDGPAASRSDSLVWLFAYVTFFVVLSFVKAPAVLIDAGPSWKREPREMRALSAVPDRDLAERMECQASERQIERDRDRETEHKAETIAQREHNRVVVQLHAVA